MSTAAHDAVQRIEDLADAIGLRVTDPILAAESILQLLEVVRAGLPETERYSS